MDVVEDVAVGGCEADGGVAPRAASAPAAAAAGAGLAAGAEPAFPPVASDELSVPWLAGFVLRFCSPLSFRVEGDVLAAQRTSVVERIAAEVDAVRGYVRAWPGTGAVLAADTQHVAEELRARLADVVHARPSPRTRWASAQTAAS